MVWENYDKKIVAANLHRLVGQVYRLLPAREEGEDWMKPLETLVNELIGMFSLLPDLSIGLAAASKLEGLYQRGKEVEFANYRRTIFECCTILSKLEQSLLE